LRWRQWRLLGALLQKAEIQQVRVVRGQDRSSLVLVLLFGGAEGDGDLAVVGSLVRGSSTRSSTSSSMRRTSRTAHKWPHTIFFIMLILARVSCFTTGGAQRRTALVLEDASLHGGASIRADEKIERGETKLGAVSFLWACSWTVVAKKESGKTPETRIDWSRGSLGWQCMYVSPFGYCYGSMNGGAHYSSLASL